MIKSRKQNAVTVSLSACCLFVRKLICCVNVWFESNEFRHRAACMYALKTCMNL